MKDLSSFTFLILGISLFSILPAPSPKAAEYPRVVINEIAWPVKAADAANGLKMETIVINEIAWMGTVEFYNDEWIVVIKHFLYL